MIDKNSF